MSAIKSFLNRHLNSEVSNFEEIGNGHFSKAYGFTHRNIEKIIRIADSDLDFKKDKLVQEKLLHSDAPIPKVLEIGPYEGGKFFCITERCKGEIFDELTIEEKEASIPAMFNALEAIHRLDISDTTGFGLIDVNFNGQNKSWAGCMLNLENHKIPYDLEEIYRRPYFDKPLFDKTYDKLRKLIGTIPEKRFFIHGDFGFDNLLIDNGKITGVIDWAEARIGDPAYDAAWLDFWSDDIPFAKVMIDQAAGRGIYPVKIHDRLLVCSFHIALGSMLFASHFDNKMDYQKVVERLKRAEERFRD